MVGDVAGITEDLLAKNDADIWFGGCFAAKGLDGFKKFGGVSPVGKGLQELVVFIGPDSSGEGRDLLIQGKNVGGVGVVLTDGVAPFAETRDFRREARDATRAAACRNALLRGSRHNIPEESLAPADVAGLLHFSKGLFSVFAEGGPVGTIQVGESLLLGVRWDVGLEGDENGEVVRSQRHFGPPLGTEQQLGRGQSDIWRGRAARLREPSRVGAVKHSKVGRVDLASKGFATGV